MLNLIITDKMIGNFQLEKKKSLLNVLGAVDCTHVKIISPATMKGAMWTAKAFTA